jgi:hypothetical protein
MSAEGAESRCISLRQGDMIDIMHSLSRGYRSMPGVQLRLPARYQPLRDAWRICDVLLLHTAQATRRSCCPKSQCAEVLGELDL